MSFVPRIIADGEQRRTMLPSIPVVEPRPIREQDLQLRQDASIDIISSQPVTTMISSMENKPIEKLRHNPPGTPTLEDDGGGEKGEAPSRTNTKLINPSGKFQNETTADRNTAAATTTTLPKKGPPKKSPGTASSNTTPTTKKKTPRRKPGARECLQIAKRFGVHVIPSKYVRIFLDYSRRGKLEHLIKIRERLDCHSRFLEHQLAGLEARIQAVGDDADLVVPAGRQKPRPRGGGGATVPPPKTARGPSLPTSNTKGSSVSGR